jgi:hypothetical protein
MFLLLLKLTLKLYLSQPHFRRPLFDAPEFTWSVEWSTFGDTFHYFFYVLKKVSPVKTRGLVVLYSC